MFGFIKSSFEKVKGALLKSRSVLGSKLRALFGKTIDPEVLEELEHLFYEADLGIKGAEELSKKVQALYRKNPDLGTEGLMKGVEEELVRMLSDKPTSLASPAKLPLVILVVGVNGNGKTTSCAKIAKKFLDEKRSVLLVAGDTFRAAATEQLTLWAERIGCPIVKGAAKSDPAAVAFDGVTAALARGIEVVIIDTAGRLQTRDDLMKELEKVRRTIDKVHPGAPHETLLVLDATTGQNGLDQAKIFHKYVPLTGLVLTKLDGTAKGGIVLNLHRELEMGVKFIGVGEGVDDLEPFNAAEFAKALVY